MAWAWLPVLLAVGYVVMAIMKRQSNRLKFIGSLPAIGSSIGKVTGVYVYPVKSMQAVSMKSATLDGAGLKGDRMLMIMSKSGKRVTQLTCPRMASLKAVFLDKDTVQIEASWMPSPLKVSLITKPDAPIHKPMVVVTSIPCIDLGDECGTWLDKALDKQGLRLLRVVPTEKRFIKDYPLWFGSSPSPHDHIQLQDYGPLLFTNESSLASINTKIPEAKRCGMDRFRANVVFAPTDSGSDGTKSAWIEDHIKTVRIGKTVLKHMAPCIRCLQPCINQASGEAGYITDGARNAQPTKALRDYHPGSAKRSITGFAPTELGGAGGLAPHFGSLLTHAAHLSAEEEKTNPDAWGTINVGDEVVVLEYHKLSWHQRLFGL